jgi:hypothetical protein
MDNNGWPGKPGVPLNPERDSEGHVWTVDGVMEIYKWVASKQRYEDTRGHWFSPTCIEGDDYYHGRIVTPAEVEARIATARKEWLAELNHDTDALMENAQRDALEEAARLAEDEPEPEGDPPPKLHGRSVKNIATASVQATKRSIAAAIRAMAKGGK